MFQMLGVCAIDVMCQHAPALRLFACLLLLFVCPFSHCELLDWWTLMINLWKLRDNQWISTVYLYWPSALELMTCWQTQDISRLFWSSSFQDAVTLLCCFEAVDEIRVEDLDVRPESKASGQPGSENRMKHDEALQLYILGHKSPSCTIV